MKFHQPPDWRKANHFVLVTEAFSQTVTAPVEVRKEGEQPRTVDMEVDTVRYPGVYGFANKEVADKFRRLANSGSEIERAYVVTRW